MNPLFFFDSLHLSNLKRVTLLSAHPVLYLELIIRWIPFPLIVYWFNQQTLIVTKTDVFWPSFKCKQTTVILYSVKKDLIPRCTIMRFANRNLTRRCTIMRFANRKLIGLVIKTKWRWSRKTSKKCKIWSTTLNWKLGK